LKKKKKFNQRAVLLKCLKILFKYAETFTLNGIQKWNCLMNKNQKKEKVFFLQFS